MADLHLCHVCRLFKCNTLVDISGSVTVLPTPHACCKWAVADWKTFSMNFSSLMEDAPLIRLRFMWHVWYQDVLESRIGLQALEIVRTRREFISCVTSYYMETLPFEQVKWILDNKLFYDRHPAIDNGPRSPDENLLLWQMVHDQGMSLAHKPWKNLFMLRSKVDVPPVCQQEFLLCVGWLKLEDACDAIYAFPNPDMAVNERAVLQLAEAAHGSLPILKHCPKKLRLIIECINRKTAQTYSQVVLNSLPCLVPELATLISMYI